MDAIVGVACLNVLEKAFDKVLLAGLPCVAVPLLSSKCCSTSVDEDWVLEFINLRSDSSGVRTRSYIPLMRAAHQLCEEPELSRLTPRTGLVPRRSSLAARHQSIAYDWLAQGGKHFRPFITLAAYDALRGAPGSLSVESVSLPDSVRRIALAIEVFHKASLVHDDIEDDDTFRYGQETLHRQYGVSTAINVGDYLIGLGYCLVSRERKELGDACTADILNRLADAHLRLSDGQGAELLWRDGADKSLTPLDALKIYALKTAPAFEAAFYAGLRLAGPAEQYEKVVTEFSRHLGVAFQILNDLKDWDGDNDNKLIACQDVLAARPTVLLALALECLPPADKAELLSLCQQPVELGEWNAEHGEGSAKGIEQSTGSVTLRSMCQDPRINRVHRLFNEARVFDKAERLVEKCRARAEAVADNVEPTELRELLYYLVGSVLGRRVVTESAPDKGLVCSAPDSIGRGTEAIAAPIVNAPRATEFLHQLGRKGYDLPKV